MSEWSVRTIGDLCDQGGIELQTGPFGSQLHASDYVEAGVPVIPTEAIKARAIDHAVLPKISPDKAAALTRHMVRAGDILFARRGVQATGQVALVRARESGFICGTGAIRLRVSKSEVRIDADYLSHLLATRDSIAWLRQHAIGATMPNLNEGIIRAFPIAPPPIAKQRRIAGILGALDDRIELTRPMVATLKEVARTLASEALTGDLQPLRTIATVQRGFGYRSAGFADGGTPMISMGSAQRRGWLKRDGIREYGEPVAEKYHVHPWDLLVVNVDLTWRLEVLGWPLIVPADLPDAVVSNDIYVLKLDAAHAWRRALVWAALLKSSARVLIEGAAKGTTVASIAATDILAVPAVGSDTLRSRALARAAEASIERAWNAEREASRLSELRDVLLPKLLSGELEVVG